jgi:flotillin
MCCSFQVKIQGQNEEMLLAACEQFLGKPELEIQQIALVTLEGHQRAIMGSMTVEEIYKDRKKFSKQVFEVASSDLVNMGITVVSYTLKDIRDEEVDTNLIIFVISVEKVNLFLTFYYSLLC